jgi:hypothetical protein
MELEDYTQEGASAVVGGVEADGAGALDIGAGKGLPGDHFARVLVDDLGIPFVGLAAGALEDPVRMTVIEDADAFEVFHEFGKVLEVSPETEEFLGGTGDEDGFLDFVAGVIRDSGTAGDCGGYADGIVKAAMAADSPHDEEAACGGKQEAGKAATGKAGYDEGRAANDGAVSLGFTDVDGANGALERIAAKAAGGGFWIERGVG